MSRKLLDTESPSYDSNRDAHDKMSINARMRNAITMVSNIDSTPGTSMGGLCNQITLSLARVYKKLDSIEYLNQQDYNELVELLRNVEMAPSRFAEGMKKK